MSIHIRVSPDLWPRANDYTLWTLTLTLFKKSNQKIIPDFTLSHSMDPILSKAFVKLPRLAGAVHPGALL